ncbi:DUF2515 family protein [Leptothoe spongobia]|uniref:DUF2515 family protein n=1 Tax=Leptothoe spongobia TAU-MAC 1115 TaxID=1967444 RepID=A0A947GJM9_9CYAN|nr:DUF2515 family protein [Leptothoe spongobia]MBT9315807.1 DUF2515 family protein [Leptothoe spongobia TAU-MAC 1115]
MKPQTLKEQFREATLVRRSQVEVNLTSRANCLFDFWEQHPEVSWVLLANLVARNTGWIMSDLVRACQCAPHSLKIPGLPSAHYQAFFAFLETGNFLIFRDVFPQLVAYAWAKRYPEQSDVFFDLLSTDPQFNVDPFIIEHWKVFFKAAKNNHWFPEWWKEPSVKRLAFALIANEQNQIHDRLLHDSQHRYLGRLFFAITRQIFIATTKLGLMKLCFAVAKSETNPETDHLLIYTMSCDFALFDNRVKVGRDLYMELFSEDSRRQRVITWARAHAKYWGSRAEYNPQQYCLYPQQANAQRKYSPPLVPWQGAKPAWPFDPTQVRPYPHLHDTPIPLPVSTQTRENIEELLSLLTATTRSLEPTSLSEQAEIIIGKSSTLQLYILLQQILGKKRLHPILP